MPLRSKRRSKEDFNDPEKPYYAEVNRNDTRFNSRLEPTLKEKFDKYCSEKSSTKREILEAALEEYMTNHPS